MRQTRNLCVECGMELSEEDCLIIADNTLLCPNCNRANYIYFVNTYDAFGIHEMEEPVSDEEDEEPYIDGYLSEDLIPDLDNESSVVPNVYNVKKKKDLIHFIVRNPTRNRRHRGKKMKRYNYPVEKKDNNTQQN